MVVILKYQNHVIDFDQSHVCILSSEQRLCEGVLGEVGEVRVVGQQPAERLGKSGVSV